MADKKRAAEHVILAVENGSIAQELELEPGDVLVSIDGQQVEDIFDYRYLIQGEAITVLIRKPDGEEWELDIEKEFDEDLGIDFGNGLMDAYRSCSNKCVFCFIDQLPKGMRETLYFKDDDSRLSFLQGNYITLT
nr:radical SAM protein [Lachnospiraceae bacterium]